METRGFEGLSTMLKVRMHSHHGSVLVWTTKVYHCFEILCLLCDCSLLGPPLMERKWPRERRGSSPSLLRQMRTQAKRKGKLQKELVVLLGVAGAEFLLSWGSLHCDLKQGLSLLCQTWEGKI